jgi:L,D-peptidoglycan transpeptidase YkuD (ErfK/YbiS/YcfS/YnhG family)
VRLWWRADRHARPPTLLPVRRITSALAWGEDPADRRYNRPFSRSADEPGDRLWRDDHLYDFVIEIDHNMRPRVAGRGSAVFLHVARPNRSPTAGCVALASRDLERLLAGLSRKTRIWIQN